MTMQALPSHDDDWWWWRRHYTWSVFGTWLKTTHIWRVYLSWIFLRSTCSIYLGYRNLLVKKHLQSFWKQMNSPLTQPHENKWWLKQKHSNLLKFSLLKSVDVRQCFTAQEIHSWVESTRELVVECTESLFIYGYVGSYKMLQVLKGVCLLLASRFLNLMEHQTHQSRNPFQERSRPTNNLSGAMLNFPGCIYFLVFVLLYSRRGRVYCFSVASCLFTIDGTWDFWWKGELWVGRLWAMEFLNCHGSCLLFAGLQYICLCVCVKGLPE